jgi:HK97 family phage portal protein
MLKRFWTAAGKALGAITGVTFTMAGIPLSQLANYESYLRAACSRVWASWKACDICANSVSNTPFVVATEGSTKPAKIKDLDKILTYPNEWQTFRELTYLTVMHLKMTGNAFWYKGDATSNGDRPRIVLPLNPKRMKIVPDGYGGVVGYVYHCDGKEVPLEPEEVIHFRRPHPDNDCWGLGDIEAGQDLFNATVNRNEWEKRFWKNGASPSGIMSTEEAVLEEDLERARQAWKRDYSGVGNSGKTAFLNGKWKYTQLGLSKADMQDLESSKWTLEQIFLLHGVPLSVAGIRDAANYATADIDNQRFKEYTILPLVLLIQDTVNTDLIAGWGERLKLTFNVTGLINMGKLVAELAPGFSLGWYSINEVRGFLKLEQKPEEPLWNQHFMSAGLVPLELAGVADLGETEEEAKKAVQRSIQAALQPKGNNEPRQIPAG